MSDIARNKEVALNYLGLIQSGDVESAEKLLAPDLDWWVAGTFPGAGKVSREALLNGFRAIRDTMTQPMQFEIEYLTAEDDRVAIACTATASRKDGSLYTQAYHMLLTIREGQIVAGRPYLDTLKFAEQVHGATVIYP